MAMEPGSWRGTSQPGCSRLEKMTLVLNAPGDSGAIADNVFLQRIELQYRTQEIGTQGFAFVQGQGKGVSLDAGKADLQVVDVTQADQPRLLTGLAPEAGRFTFMAEADRLYLVLSEAGYLQPELQQPDEYCYETEEQEGDDKHPDRDTDYYLCVKVRKVACPTFPATSSVAITIHPSGSFYIVYIVCIPRTQLVQVRSGKDILRLITTLRR